jgi:hypothetical protein
LTDKTIKIEREGGLPYTFISINGIHYKVILDFGSSAAFSLSKDKLAKQLLEQYEFTDNERERHTPLMDFKRLKKKSELCLYSNWETWDLKMLVQKSMSKVRPE